MDLGLLTTLIERLRAESIGDPDWVESKQVFEYPNQTVEVRNGPTNLDSAVSEIFLGFQAANSGAAWPKYTASGVRRSSALCRRLAL